MREFGNILFKRYFFVALLVLSGVFGRTVGADDESRVAYIEEVEVFPDGTQRVYRYKPGQRPVPVTIPGPTQTEPRQRGLTSIEKLELDRLERDFAHGKITESEYYQRRRDIYLSTFVDGTPDEGGLLNQRRSF